MMNNAISDAQLIAAIKGKTEERNQALKQFFHNKNIKEFVINYVINHGGNKQDGQDIFHDAVILFDRGIRENAFKGQGALTTYFISIAKWRWVSHKRKFNRNLELKPEQYDEPVESVDVRVIEGERLSAIEDILTRIGDRCKKVLKLYKLSYSMLEIAQIIGFSSAEIAKQECSKCRKKFRDYVLTNPIYKNLLDIEFYTTK